MRSETSHNGRNLISELPPCCSPRSVATNVAVVLYVKKSSIEMVRAPRDDAVKPAATEKKRAHMVA